MKGLVNLNKPKGWTSRDAVNKVRNILHVKQIGHMGTLDPQGEGVLIIGVGKATRLFDAMLTKDKVYEATFVFGYETDTLDGDGKIIASNDIFPTLDDIESVIPRFIGENIEQMPPNYSAKNIDGVRAYDLARKGVEFTLKPAKVSIYSIRLVERVAANEYLFRIHCSAGTYIRSICRDVAYALGSLATMTSIKRLRAGNFCVEDSVTIDDVATCGESVIVPLEKALDDYFRYDVPDCDYQKLINGIKLDVSAQLPSLFTVYCKGELFGLGECVDGKLRIKTYLRD